MHRHYVNELEIANKRLLEMSGKVEQMIILAADALIHQKSDQIDQVIAMDTHVDSEEVRIEEECLKILALHQPVATDLRRITSMLKINNDLERMGDLACNIVERATAMLGKPLFPIPPQIEQMSNMTVEMVRNSLDAFVSQNVDLAEQVIHNDAAVNEMIVAVIGELSGNMSDNQSDFDTALNCFSAAQHFEQISDHAKNIASDLIYMVSGRIIRHRQAANMAK